MYDYRYRKPDNRNYPTSAAAKLGNFLQWIVVIFFTLILLAYWTDTIWGIIDWIASVNSQGG